MNIASDLLLQSHQFFTRGGSSAGFLRCAIGRGSPEQAEGFCTVINEEAAKNCLCIERRTPEINGLCLLSKISHSSSVLSNCIVQFDGFGSLMFE